MVANTQVRTASLRPRDRLQQERPRSRAMLALLLATPAFGFVATSTRNPGAARLASRASAPVAVEGLRFLTEEQCREVASSFGTPAYVYDEATLKKQATTALDFPNAYGLTVRFAMKALPNAAVLQTFDRLGLHVDASSGYEVRRAMAAGVAAERISLSSQEIPLDMDELLGFGIKFNACSLQQLREYGKLRPGARGEQLGVRFNPGLGSGGTGKTNVGGPSSSFGIWHELMPEVQAILKEYDLEPARVHTHIGSGSDPAVWQRVAGLSLGLCEQIPSVSVLNLGGGYKVGRMAGEPSTDLAVVGVPVKAAFEEFAERTSRKLALEVEPGTFLVANAGSLVSRVQDLVTTGGTEGHTFLKLDSGAPPPEHMLPHTQQHTPMTTILAIEQPSSRAESKPTLLPLTASTRHDRGAPSIAVRRSTSPRPRARRRSP